MITRKRKDLALKGHKDSYDHSEKWNMSVWLVISIYVIPHETESLTVTGHSIAHDHS